MNGFIILVIFILISFLMYVIYRNIADVTAMKEKMEYVDSQIVTYSRKLYPEFDFTIYNDSKDPIDINTNYSTFLLLNTNNVQTICNIKYNRESQNLIYVITNSNDSLSQLIVNVNDSIFNYVFLFPGEELKLYYDTVKNIFMSMNIPKTLYSYNISDNTEFITNNIWNKFGINRRIRTKNFVLVNITGVQIIDSLLNVTNNLIINYCGFILLQGILYPIPLGSIFDDNIFIYLDTSGLIIDVGSSINVTNQFFIQILFV
jgi:hypothetical protein